MLSKVARFDRADKFLSVMRGVFYKLSLVRGAAWHKGSASLGGKPSKLSIEWWRGVRAIISILFSFGSATACVKKLPFMCL